ncbi:MAG: baeRF10 domain-containing protein [Thermoleophilia bacterium]
MLSASEISSLRGFTSHDQLPVVSLYLNVDGSRYPTRADYETELSYLISQARKSAADNLGLSRDQQARLDSDLSSIGEYVNLEFQRNGTRGLVIFACQAEGLWQISPLKIPMENNLYVDWKPQVAPLIETLSAFSHICVLLTSKETARIFSVYAGEITERTEILDQVLKHHEQGGWEQSKLQRRHDLQVRNHLKKACDATMEHFKKEKFEQLVVGTAGELWPDLERLLHPYLKERLLGRFPVDIGASADEVLAKVTSLEAQKRHQEESSLLDSLGPELSSGRIYVGGLDDVLAVLNQRRVDLLLVENSYTEPGRHCQACNTLEFGEEVCPVCGRQAEHVGDVVEEAKELAVRQDATVMTVPSGHPAIIRAGHIAARLRY